MSRGDGANYVGGTPGPTRFSAHSQLIGVHGNWRDERGLLGVFGSAGDASPDELAPGAIRHGLIGAEGQLYWNVFTLYGQAGYDSTIGSLSSGPGTIDNIQARQHSGLVRPRHRPRLHHAEPAPGSTFLYTMGRTISLPGYRP
jgi:hypothetical protein